METDSPVMIEVRVVRVELEGSREVLNSIRVLPLQLNQRSAWNIQSKLSFILRLPLTHPK
jgi:hypothetical protein